MSSKVGFRSNLTSPLLDSEFYLGSLISLLLSVPWYHQRTVPLGFLAMVTLPIRARMHLFPSLVVTLESIRTIKIAAT
jgi:hypothetical protein